MFGSTIAGIGTIVVNNDTKQFPEEGKYTKGYVFKSDKVEKLLSFVDKSYVSFKGFHDEILYLLTFKDEKLERRNELLIEIMNNDSISLAIKERIRKLNEFEKYQ